jgi:hypothetical protein
MAEVTGDLRINAKILERPSSGRHPPASAESNAREGCRVSCAARGKLKSLGVVDLLALGVRRWTWRGDARSGTTADGWAGSLRKAAVDGWRL